MSDVIGTLGATGSGGTCVCGCASSPCGCLPVSPPVITSESFGTFYFTMTDAVLGTAVKNPDFYDPGTPSNPLQGNIYGYAPDPEFEFPAYCQVNYSIFKFPNADSNGNTWSTPGNSFANVFSSLDNVSIALNMAGAGGSAPDIGTMFISLPCPLPSSMPYSGIACWTSSNGVNFATAYTISFDPSSCPIPSTPIGDPCGY